MSLMPPLPIRNKRARCFACKRLIVLNKGGEFRHHYRLTWNADRGNVCEGSGTHYREEAPEPLPQEGRPRG